MTSRLGTGSQPEEEDGLLWVFEAFGIWEDEVKVKEDEGSAE